MQQEFKPACHKDCQQAGCCTDRLSLFLGKEGGRLTKERSLLLHVSCELAAHFTPEGIQQTLAKQGSRMAMTTIYRNLPALEKAGIIRRTTFREEDNNGAATYEHVWGRPHHDHLLCQSCGKRVEFQYDALEVLQDEVARKHGFRLEYHHLELVGLCPDCDRQDRADGEGGPSS
jgi:Fur family ferric uptake transcriptional regulator